jgi:hypothetical protein
MIAPFAKRSLGQAEGAVLRRHPFRLTGSRLPIGHNKSSNLAPGTVRAGRLAVGRARTARKADRLTDEGGVIGLAPLSLRGRVIGWARLFLGNQRCFDRGEYLVYADFVHHGRRIGRALWLSITLVQFSFDAGS